MQAIIFGAAHANYPAQPAYARLVELIIPSFLFGGIFLRFGLLPAVITHYAYDVLLFALPIFLSTAPRAWLNQGAILLFAFFPLLIVLYRRYQAGRWITLGSDALNDTWQPTQQEALFELPKEKTTVMALTQKHKIILLIICALGTVAWFAFSPKSTDAPPLSTGRDQAIAVGQQALLEQKNTLDSMMKML